MASNPFVPFAPFCSIVVHIASLNTLAELHDSIYREKVLRARAMTPVDRFDSGLELSNSAMQRMLEGAMWQLDTSDSAEGWREVRNRMIRLSAARDHAFYSNQPDSS